jgi:hypothetical protein
VANTAAVRDGLSSINSLEDGVMSSRKPAMRELVRRFTDASVAKDVDVLPALLPDDVRSSTLPPQLRPETIGQPGRARSRNRQLGGAAGRLASGGARAGDDARPHRRAPRARLRGNGCRHRLDRYLSRTVRGTDRAAKRWAESAYLSPSALLAGVVSWRTRVR